MAKEIFGANLKMNPESEGKFRNLMQNYLCFSYPKDKEIIVFAPLAFLFNKVDDGVTIVERMKEAGIRLGAQDASEYVSGAHTGETSPLWLKEYGIGDVLIGHSEVRGEYEALGANNLKINQKFRRQIANAFKHGFRVTYCVGETAEEKNRNMTEDVLIGQIVYGLDELNKADLEGRLIIAYEPRWAIGGDRPTPTMQEIKNAHAVIREFLRIYHGVSNPDCVPILYGGSMKPENAAQIMGINGVNGGLIGSASLDAEKFAKIVNYDRHA